jgi:AcrR family transcriptional regulator
VSREAIVDGTVAVLTENYLTDWTVDSVAAKVKCAKGLVLYHFRSKDSLLGQAAERVRENHASRRIGAVQGLRGTQALDRLWDELAKEVRSGAFGLWVILVGHTPTRKAAARTAAHDASLTAAASTALGIPSDSASLTMVPAALDGFGLELLQGRPTADVRDRYDAFWLTVLSEADS